MENGNNRTARSRGALMMYIFGIFMLVFYLGMAYMFLFSRVLAERMSPTVRYVMGGVFLLYGVYRPVSYTHLTLPTTSRV